MEYIQVSIIIVNYNTREILRNCLNSVTTYTKDLLYEVIVIDNASSDHSQEMLKQDFPEVRLIESPQNIGFGKANNLGFKIARADIFLLLNSDTLLIDNSIKILYDHLSAHQETGACGGLLLDENQNIGFSYGNKLSLKSEISSFFINPFCHQHKLSPEHLSKATEVDYVLGADMMIKRKVFEKTGVFDADFFLYCEETELSYRIKKAGYKIDLIPQSRIIHLDGMSGAAQESLVPFITEERWFSRFLYFRKVYTYRHPFYLYCIHSIFCFISIIIFFLTRNKKKFMYWRNKYQIIAKAYKRYKIHIHTKQIFTYASA